MMIIPYRDVEHLDWFALNQKILWPRAGKRPKQPVFSPDVLGFVARADPVFAEHGFIRPVAIRSGKSREPDLS
jgi:hypothetical protein